MTALRAVATLWGDWCSLIVPDNQRRVICTGALCGKPVTENLRLMLTVPRVGKLAGAGTACALVGVAAGVEHGCRLAR